MIILVVRSIAKRDEDRLLSAGARIYKEMEEDGRLLYKMLSLPEHTRFYHLDISQETDLFESPQQARVLRAYDRCYIVELGDYRFFYADAPNKRMTLLWNDFSDLFQRLPKEEVLFEDLW